MSEPRRPAPEADPVVEQDRQSTVGIYDAPERGSGRLPMLIILLVVVVVLAAAAAIWLL
jgi:flagellar basal body-associated protein FliL